MHTEIDNHISGDEITIRRLGADDARAVRRLAELDSARAPQGELLGAEVGGTLLAVMPAAGGAMIADPFRATAGLRYLLEAQARSARPGPSAGRRSLRRLLSPARAVPS